MTNATKRYQALLFLEEWLNEVLHAPCEYVQLAASAAYVAALPRSDWASMGYIAPVQEMREHWSCVDLSKHMPNSDLYTVIQNVKRCM